MKRLFAILFLIASVTATCGGGSEYDGTVVTQTPPIVTRIDPAAAKSGDTVTIFGSGFSASPEANVIAIADQSAFAETFTMLDDPVGSEIEALTFTVPDGITPGDFELIVFVINNVSNADITIEITP